MVCRWVVAGQETRGGEGPGLVVGSGTFSRVRWVVVFCCWVLPAAGWCARWVWSTPGVREKRRQPARVGRKGCWVLGRGSEAA